MKKITLFFIFFSSVIFSDKGMLPLKSDISIYEPGQKAIIGWDGKKECMILSVDAYADTSVKVMEVLPLPSKPKIKEGNLQSFREVQKLISKNGFKSFRYLKGLMPPGKGGISSGVEMLFYKKIGAHSLTCVKALKYEEFVEWANNFIKSEGIDSINISNSFSNIIKSYLEEGIIYFVFDIIELTKASSSIQPIIYEFESRYLFFPLNISRLAKGNTRIQLFLLTQYIPWERELQPFRVGSYSLIKKEVPIDIQFELQPEEIISIDSTFSNYFKKKIWFTAIEYEGPINRLYNDLRLNKFCKIVEY